MISGVYLGVKWKLNLMENLCRKVQEMELENFRITAESGGLQISQKKLSARVRCGLVPRKDEIRINSDLLSRAEVDFPVSRQDME